MYFIAFLLTIARMRAIPGENLHSKNKAKENVVMKKLYKIFLIGTMSLMLVEMMMRMPQKQWKQRIKKNCFKNNYSVINGISNK